MRGRRYLDLEFPQTGPVVVEAIYLSGTIYPGFATALLVLTVLFSVETPSLWALTNRD